MKELITGAINGAITDPESDVAEEHAEMYYDEIRSFSTDVEKIAHNTNFTKDQIRMVKNYLFYNEHDLGGVIKRFDTSFRIAESWRRLAFAKNDIQKHDVMLIQHELMEMQLVAKGVSQNLAHDETNKKYNYTLESDKYYEKLGLKSKNKKSQKNSGGISYLHH